jgi:hypothetical protein
MELNCKKCNKSIKKLSEKEETLYRSINIKIDDLFMLCNDCNGFNKKPKLPSFLKAFELEEVIEVRRVYRRKYSVNWKRLFMNFVYMLMFWKRKPGTVAVSATVVSNDVYKDNHNRFIFTKALADWTVKNTPVRDGFGDGDIDSKAKAVNEALEGK